MKTTLTKRLTAVFAAVMVGLVPTAAALAVSTWGPARPALTYVKNAPGADHVVFNSFTNTDVYGDERTFFDGKSSNFTVDGGYQDSIDVVGKNEALVRVYIHNNADPSLNGSNLDGAGVALNTKVRVALPTTTGRSAVANAFISADNASPKEVFDSLDFVTSGAQAFSLSYEPGTARIYNNATGTAGRALDDSIVTTGAPIGYDKNDGRVPGCFQYAAYVTLKVKINPATVSFTKTVGVPGSGVAQQELTNEHAGDTVTWVLQYKNNTGGTVNNLNVRDQLPADVTVVPGSVKQFDAKNPNGLLRSDTGLFSTSGVDLGAYTAGSSGHITYQTKVKSVMPCGTTPLTNNAWIKGEGIADILAWARISVTAPCAPTTPVTPTTPTTPTTPSLPDTGAEGLATGVLGTGALGYTISAYVRSKRSVLDAVRGIAKRS